jgi:hypothetical protein
MYKCLFDKTTGQIFAFCMPTQNLDRLMSNYTNCDYIETDYVANKIKHMTPIKVDIATRQVVEVAQ